MTRALSLEQLQVRLWSSLAAGMGMDVAALDVAHTDVRAEADRARSAMAVAYHVGESTIVRVDPAIEADLSGLRDASAAMTDVDLRSWSESHGWEFIDGGDQHLLAGEALQPRPPPADARLVRLSRDDPDDRSLIEALLSGADPDDVDEAEFDMGDLDPNILGLVDVSGALGCLVSGRPWDDDPIFDDVGVLTRDDLRGHGWGISAVTAFCDDSFKRDHIPLYRCNWSVAASKALATRMGFTTVCRVSAIRRPD